MRNLLINATQHLKPLSGELDDLRKNRPVLEQTIQSYSCSAQRTRSNFLFLQTCLLIKLISLKQVRLLVLHACNNLWFAKCSVIHLLACISLNQGFITIISNLVVSKGNKAFQSRITSLHKFEILLIEMSPVFQMSTVI